MDNCTKEPKRLHTEKGCKTLHRTSSVLICPQTFYFLKRSSSARTTRALASLARSKDFRRKKLNVCGQITSVLSGVAILLTIALFVRIEIVVRDTKLMDSKFSQEIQQVKDDLKETAERQASVNKDAAIGM